MAGIKDENPEDRTIGIPKSFGKAPDAFKAPDPSRDKNKESERPPSPPPSSKPREGRPPPGPARPAYPMPSLNPPEPEEERFDTVLPPKGFARRVPGVEPGPPGGSIHPSDMDSNPRPGRPSTGKPGSPRARSGQGPGSASPPLDPGWDRDEASSGFRQPEAPLTPDSQFGMILPSPPAPASRSNPVFESPWSVFGPEEGPSPAEMRINPPPEAKKPLPASGFAPAPVPASPFGPGSVRPPTSAPRPSSRPSPADDPLRTVGGGKGMIVSTPRRLLMIQYYDGVGAWHDLEQLRIDGHVLGRDSFRRDMPVSAFLAADHLRLRVDGNELIADEGETINGVYRNVPPGRPAELVSGARFEIGQHVIDFIAAPPPPPTQPLISEDGETLRSRSVHPIGFLDFIGADGEPTMRFPLVKPDGTVIGREAKSSDIVLLGDDWASRAHAKLVRRDDRFFLEDLGSTNGTFTRLTGPAAIRTARAHKPEEIDVLLMGAVLVRVVEF